ncbi:hypothetical protein V3C99_010304 [Haemonchus contortus]
MRDFISIKMKFYLLLLLVLAETATSLDPICRERLKSGYCQGRLIRYGYSLRERKCVKFIYTGCSGNRNNFKTMKECRKKCVFRN